MDHTEALPDDALAAILGRLARQDLAACRRVRRAWLAIVDGRRLLPRNHHLPDSVEGIFANYWSYERPHFLGRPSTRHRGVDYGNLHFLPGYSEDNNIIVDHCSGLLLYGDGYKLYCCGGLRVFCVVNPATRRWERLPGTPDKESSTAYLAFDPTTSPHYKVFLIQPKDLGLFDVTDCESAEVSP
ncbi:F-box protein At5g07610-like [Aegilops tauschii subsp. strangulata]|uniref:F-box protein At5g07610-like n=1 Tax=Aegilops tauschii subsp. strangulata TaxID=200361 RepID=UPI000989B466|nr:F-box protein At5g07610-like [Aegilops tauschii subsp. strangulata]